MKLTKFVHVNSFVGALKKIWHNYEGLLKSILQQVHSKCVVCGAYNLINNV